MKKKLKLDAYELDLEKNLGKAKKTKNENDLKKSLTIAAQKHSLARKPITIRLLNSDVEIMKLKASKMGIPYQTYINILIHRDALSA